MSGVLNFRRLCQEYQGKRVVRELEDSAEYWDHFAKIDPLWAVLAYPEKEGNKWVVGDLFATGAREIESVMAYVESLGIPLAKDAALDFGCGVGRLTQALARYFDLCYGVDISRKMIGLAAMFNQQGDKCRYLVNQAGDLQVFATGMFSFVYSNIVLQHIRRRFALAYIREFLRVVKPGGLVIFQVPSESSLDKPLSVKLRRAIKVVTPSVLYGAYRRVRFGTPAVIERHCIKRDDVLKHVEANGGRVVDIVEDRAAGPMSVSFRYCVTRE